MSLSSLKILRRYEYDATDRLSGLGLVQRFYQEGHLTTEIDQHTQRTIFRHQAQPLAQSQSDAGVTESRLLVTDRANSLLQTLSGIHPQQFAYTAYGYHPAASGLSRLLGFNGVCPDDITGNYPLGQGNRFYNPVLMRFLTADELSPFDEGGINAYTYCKNDAINNYDPSGNSPIAFRPWNFSNSAPTGLNLIKRPSVIAKNPLYTVRTASNISSPISVNSNPILTGMLDRPLKDLRLPGPSQPIFHSRNERSKLQLELTSTKNTTQTNQINSYRRKMAAVEREFDQHLQDNPNFPTFATPEQSERLSKINYWLNQPETTGAPRKRLQQQKLDAIRKIKRDTLSQLSNSSRSIRK